MKNVSNINWSKLFRKAAFTSLFLFLLSALQVQAADSTKTHPPVEIKYAGDLNGSPVFQINVDNQNDYELYLSVKDENGDVIYSDIVKEKKYSRRIQFEDADVSDLKIVVTLSAKKSYQTEIFQISKQTRRVEDVQVSRIR